MWNGYNKLDREKRESEESAMSRASFDKAFKTAAVKLIIEESFSVKEVSAQLDVHVNSLYRWGLLFTIQKLFLLTVQRLKPMPINVPLFG